MVPFETHAAFWPLITQCLPSLRAMQLARSFGSVNELSVTARVSLPWSGSVIAQQPMSRESGAQKRSTSAGRPESRANILWKFETPRLIARPESPQPISSAIMARRRAFSTGPRPESSSSNRSRPSSRWRSKTGHSGESLAITSAGSASLSRACPAGRITSLANLCTVSRSSRSVSERSDSMSTRVMGASGVGR